MTMGGGGGKFLSWVPLNPSAILNSYSSGNSQPFAKKLKDVKQGGQCLIEKPEVKIS